MEWMGLNDIRESFLSFFESKGHKRLPSFPLLPKDDKSLLLINSGMAPMKKWFLGQEEPPCHRVTTCQKCIRTPDIDNVGKDDRHGTYFEMLGNFSFGDYFKKEAITWAWEFLTEVMKLPKERLYITVYNEDDEAYDYWRNMIGVPEDHIYRFGKEDNFWEIGSGPCGPCSEIHYDRGVEHGCGSPDCGVGCECDRFIEVWNLVFSQFDSDGEGHYERMEHPNIDTGMGMERLACIMQGVDNLFEVDTVQNIMKKISEIAGVKYHDDPTMDISLRVITDHVRSSTFMISDGVMPANEGRGYVLKRLLRRAARHGRLLGINEPFIYKIVDTVVEENKIAYPELAEHAGYIKKVILSEEERFCRTIDQGFELLNDYVAQLEEKGEKVLPGDVAFRLYDTFGFPLDLTEDILEDRGITVDEEAFNTLMGEQKQRAREARASANGVSWVEDSLSALGDIKTKFVGYNRMDSAAEILAILVNGQLVKSISEGDEGVVILDSTPFYAEMGGQVADRGTIRTETAEFTVTDVQKNKGGKFMHYGRLVSGSLAVGDTVTASIDEARRKAIMRAHSATHLLDYALRTVLGDHAHQAGSLVEPDRLRYDFTHFSAVTAEELVKISRLVSELILDGMPVETKEMPIAEAKKLGAIALFGEKYGDVVRVVNMGGKSIELCGGTHVDNTAKVGPFRITSESSVASGVRRIEAVTGEAFLNLVDEMNMRLLKAAEMLKTTPGELISKAQSSMNEIRELHQTVEKMKDKLFAGDVDSLMFSAKDVNGLKVVTASRENTDANDLRKLGDFLRDKNPNTVAALGSVNGEKVTLLAVCGKNAIARGVKAGDIIKNIAPIVGGRGGGKPDSAMGGGTNAIKLDDALAAVDDYVAANVKD